MGTLSLNMNACHRSCQTFVFKWVRSLKSLYILCPPRSLVTKEDEIIPCFFEIMTITIIHETGIWTKQDFMGWKHPTLELNQPGSQEFQQGSRGEVDDGVTDQQTPRCPKLKDGGSAPSYGVWCMSNSITSQYWCLRRIFVGNEFLWLFLCDGGMMSNPGNAFHHSSLPHYLIPYHQPENQELDPIKTATHNVSQLTNEHGTFAALCKLELAFYLFSSWTHWPPTWLPATSPQMAQRCWKNQMKVEYCSND